MGTPASFVTAASIDSGNATALTKIGFVVISPA